MCYYNGQKVTRAEYIRLKQLEKTIANYGFLDKQLIDGFDYGNSAVLKPIAGKEDFDLVEMEWGFIPSWLKSYDEATHMRRGGINPATGKFDTPLTTLNAIGEEMLEKKMYQKSAREKRCLVLSSGFYEWRHIYPKNKKTGQPLKTAIKYPYYITLPEKEYFYMAGIYNTWTDKTTGESLDSFAIVTTKANPLMEEVHNAKKRMPTILNEELAYEWMFGKLDDKRITEIAFTQYPYEEMYAYSLNKDFRNALNPLERVDYSELPPINLPRYLEEAALLKPDSIEKDDLRQGNLFG